MRRSFPALGGQRFVVSRSLDYRDVIIEGSRPRTENLLAILDKRIAADLRRELVEAISGFMASEKVDEATISFGRISITEDALRLQFQITQGATLTPATRAATENASAPQDYFMLGNSYAWPAEPRPDERLPTDWYTPLYPSPFSLNSYPVTYTPPSPEPRVVKPDIHVVQPSRFIQLEDSS